MMTEEEVRKRQIKDLAAISAVTKLRGFRSDRSSNNRVNMIQRYVADMPDLLQIRLLDDYEAYLKDQVNAHGISLPEPVK